MAVWDIKERNNLVRANDNRPDRLVEMGGFEPGHTANGSFITMTSSGDSSDFGDLAKPRTLFGGAAASSSTRGLFYGGEAPGGVTDIDSITMASTGNASDHGDLTTAVGYAASTSNGIRALVAGGNSVINVIGHGSIASTGNFADFGDLAESRNALVGISSTTRAIFAGGTDGTSPSPGYLNRIDFVTINSTGNAADFGDLSGKSGYLSAAQSKTKAFFIGGATGGDSSKNNVATDVITMATTGNAQEFGTLTQATRAAASNANARSAFTLGGANPSANNVIQKFDMASLGSAVDYADLNASKHDNKGASGAHGGIDWDGLHPQRPSVTYMPGSGRAIFAGGRTPSFLSTMDKISIPTKGNASDFGNLAATTRDVANASSLTRALTAGGYVSDYTDTIESVEMATEGNGSDFGNLLAGTYSAQTGNIGNTTRGIFSGGHVSPTQTNVMQYVTIATVGNTTDFGNLSLARQDIAGVSNSTRGINGGGVKAASPYQTNIIDYVTIASTGDAADFGDLLTIKSNGVGLSSSTRGTFGGGYITDAVTNVNEYITIASTGNSTDFGNLTVARQDLAGASNSTRGIIGGGAAPGVSNVLDFFTIASTGNSADFGDLTAVKRGPAGNSDSHGGLQG